MTDSRSITTLVSAAVIPLTALALASCGGGGNDATASTASPKTANGQPATVGVADSGLGKILVNSNGRTLYLFKKDQGANSACFGQCAKDWPPLRSTRNPTLGNGAVASKVSTTMRSDGQPQVTYDGQPLYLFEGDHKAGDASGQGLNAFGAGWYVVSPAGNQISGQPASSSTPSSGGGTGY